MINLLTLTIAKSIHPTKINSRNNDPMDSTKRDERILHVIRPSSGWRFKSFTLAGLIAFLLLQTLLHLNDYTCPNEGSAHWICSALPAFLTQPPILLYAFELFMIISASLWLIIHLSYIILDVNFIRISNYGVYLHEFLNRRVFISWPNISGFSVSEWGPTAMEISVNYRKTNLEFPCYIKCNKQCQLLTHYLNIYIESNGVFPFEESGVNKTPAKEEMNYKGILQGEKSIIVDSTDHSLKDEIERLYVLRQKGALTEDEFTKAKARLIDEY